MKGALAITPTPESKWTVRSGPMTGAVRLMSLPSFVIGRSPDCEFVIVNDPKCSRRHASIRWTPTGFEVTTLSDANKIWVNGNEVRQSFLQDNDVLKLGETEMQFNIMAAPALVPRTPPMPLKPERPPAPVRARNKKSRPKPKGNSNRFLIYGVVAGIFLWLVLSPDAKKKKEQALRTEQQIQADIETATKLKEQAERVNAVDQQLAVRQAQENYVKGFRDYRKHQYERALGSFGACLALQPDHALCRRYERLAQRKFDELIQYQMVLGRKYRDQNQYKSCRASFRNVMVMVKDANSAAYKEAKVNYEACNALVEGRY